MATGNVSPRDYYVYALFRLDGSPFYVGKGRQGRWLNHEQRAKKGASHKDNIICQIMEVGVSVPKEKLIENLSDAEARQIEIDIIRLVGRRPIGPLVNQTDGGDGVAGYKKSPETRALHAASNRRRTLSPYTRAKIGEGQRAASTRPGRREQLQENGRKAGKARIGKKRPAAACKNMRAGQWRRHHPPNPDQLALPL